MRKLGIILAVMVAATLGYSGTASAQEQICDEVTQRMADGAQEEPFNTFDDSAAGLHESCNQSVDNSKLMPSPLLCGVAKDAGELTGSQELDDGIDDIHAGLDENLEPFNEAIDFETPCPNGDGGNGDDDDNNGDDDDDTQVEAVQRSNATADGGLPRTGGELFAGAGLGLMSLGALVRRFLP